MEQPLLPDFKVPDIKKAEQAKREIDMFVYCAEKLVEEPATSIQQTNDRSVWLGAYIACAKESLDKFEAALRA